MKNITGKFLNIILLAAFFCIHADLFAARVDTVLVNSSSMNKGIKSVVIVPDSYQKTEKHFPVVYLLHGYSGNYGSYAIEVPSVKKYVDEFQIIVVCPDGNFMSWYVNSPMVKNSLYETFIAEELPKYIDTHFKTQANRKYRAITGLSMGGYGAMYLAAKHPEIFGAAGSMSGALDLGSYGPVYGLPEIFGAPDPKYLNEFSVVTLLPHFKNSNVNLVIDCGTQDIPFIDDARKVHEELMKLEIPHDYVERNGKHEWEYWRRAIGYQLLFFKNHFDQ